MAGPGAEMADAAATRAARAVASASISSGPSRRSSIRAPWRWRRLLEHLELLLGQGVHGVLAELGVKLVPAADVVEVTAREHLELQVDERRLILARLPLPAGVLGLAGLLPSHVRADLDELLGDGDGPEEIRGDNLEDATLDGRGGLGVEASLVVLVALRGALRGAHDGEAGSRQAPGWGEGCDPTDGGDERAPAERGVRLHRAERRGRGVSDHIAWVRVWIRSSATALARKLRWLTRVRRAEFEFLVTV